MKTGVPIFTTSTSFEIYGQTQWMMQDMYFLLLSKLKLCICTDAAMCGVLFVQRLNCIIVLGCIVASKAVSVSSQIDHKAYFPMQNFHMIFFGGKWFCIFLRAGLRSTCVAQPTITNSFFCKSQNYPGI